MAAFFAGSPSASPTPQPELCVTVQTSQTSIQRGQKASYAVTVGTVNGPVSNVTVTLTAQPASQKPTFTSGCAKGNGGASCKISSITDKKPVSLQAQIAVPSNASSVSSVKLTATAAVSTTATWTPPAAAVPVQVTAASSSRSASPSGSSSSSTSQVGSSALNDTPAGSVPLGPQPSLDNGTSSIIGAGNASGLFPAIQPHPSPSPADGSGLRAEGNPQDASPVSSSALTPGATVLPAQVAGLIALALALLLTMTRMSRRHPRGKAAKAEATDPKGPRDAKEQGGDPATP